MAIRPNKEEIMEIFGVVLGVILTALVLLYACWVIRSRVRQIKNGHFCDCSRCSKSCGKGSCVYSGQQRNGEWI